MQTRQQWSKVVEKELKDCLRNYLMGLDDNLVGRSYIARHELYETHHARHNYQRDRIRAEARIAIIYANTVIGTIDKVKKTASLAPLKVDNGKKTFYVQKLLEKILYYDYMDLRVVK